MIAILQDFTFLDVGLILAISLFAGFAMRHWDGLFWMVIAALVADCFLPLLFYLVAGDTVDAAWTRVSDRYVFAPGGALIWRAIGYFLCIPIAFFIKRNMIR